MKCLMVAHAFAPECVGGTELTVEALARGLQEDGHEVVIVTGTLRGGEPRHMRDLGHRGLRVIQLPREDLYFESWFKAWSPTVSQAFGQLLREIEPDLVHVHHWLRLSSDLVRTAVANGARTVVTTHDYFTALASPIRRLGVDRPEPPPVPSYVSAAERVAAFEFHRRDFVDELRAADLRLAPTRAHAEGLSAMLPVDVGAFAVHAPPMLHRPLRPPQPKPDSAPRGKRLVTWGTWYADKGLEPVLAALREVAGAGWTLEVYGEPASPDYAEHLAACIEGLPVRMHGRFEPEALAAVDADYAVLPSMVHESYGLVLDEAMALGLPILATDVPAYRERAPAECVLWFGDGDGLAELLRSDAPAGLRAPCGGPARTAADATAELLEHYHRVLRSPAVPPAPALVDGAERLRVLHARAERRLWSALQQPEPPSPPDSFLRS